MRLKQKDYEPLVVAYTGEMSREKWLEYRRTGIGGSDAAAVLGVSPFMTARDLYYDKLGITPAIVDDDNWVQLEVGNLLEDLVARIFQTKTGYRVSQSKTMYRHPDHHFMVADIDYLAELSDGSKAIVEIKTTNYNNKDKWFRGAEETVPLQYEIQGRHYMTVMNLSRVYYCCLYGNSESEVVIRCIDRDLAYESELIALEENFWSNHIETRIPPPYTENGDLTLESIRRHHGTADTKAPEVCLEGDCGKEITRFLELQELKRELDKQIKILENEMGLAKGKIVDAMGRSCVASCSIQGAPYEIFYQPVYRPGIDKAGLANMKERYPGIYEEYVTVSESRRFHVKRKEREAA